MKTIQELAALAGIVLTVAALWCLSSCAGHIAADSLPSAALFPKP